MNVPRFAVPSGAEAPTKSACLAAMALPQTQRALTRGVRPHAAAATTTQPVTQHTAAWLCARLATSQARRVGRREADSAFAH